MSPIVYSLLSLLFWGLWSVFADIGTESVPAYTSAFVISVISSLTFFGLVIYKDQPFIPEPSTGLFFIFLAGVFTALASITYYSALSIGGRVGLVTTIGSLYFIVPVIVGFLVFGEAISMRQSVGIIFAVISTVLITGH